MSFNPENIQLTEDQKNRIAEVEYLKMTEYFNLDFEKTIQYKIKRYINPIQRLTDITTCSFADCGAGFGWLSFSFLLAGGKEATLCDIDEERLNAAAEIANILGLDDRCSFIAAPMQDLQFDKDQFDIFASVETLEHVGNDNIDKCLEIIANSAKKLAIITTPNKLFPLVIHDNKIPFSHWVPSRWRKNYTRLFGVIDTYPNDFVAPWRLRSIKRKFKPGSVTLTFDSYNSWKNSYPFYSPYNFSNRWKESPAKYLTGVYFILAKLLGKNSYFISPNLCRIWIKK